MKVYVAGKSGDASSESSGGKATRYSYMVFTVSAADMQWPELLQTITRQYGVLISDNDVEMLTFEQRSM